MTRDSFIRHALLHHLTGLVSALFWDSLGGAWQGDFQDGAYNYHNGCGDYYTLEWNTSDLVALIFAHESERSQWDVDEDERAPYRHLVGLPQACRPLVERSLEGYSCEELVTSGLWTDAEGRVVVGPDFNPRWGHGLEMLWRYGLSLREAMLGEQGQSWLVAASLTPAHAEALLAVHARLCDGPTTLTPQEQATLLQPPPGTERRVRLKEFWSELAAVGVQGAPGADA
jgi:hypothetical protein